MSRFGRRRQQSSIALRSTVFAACAAFAAAAPLLARDDFLRATSGDLTAREKQALEARIAELGHPDHVVRNKAVRRIAAMGKYALPALLETLKRSSDPALLRNVCFALGALGDARSLALLERWFLAELPGEEAARAALLALARGRSPPTPELSERLRKLVLDAPLATIRECALLCAGARRVVGLPEILKGPIQSERSARIRGCMLIALAESEGTSAAPLIAPFLDPRRVRDVNLRRAALYATARLADPALLVPLLKFEPDPRYEVAAYAVALGAFADPLAIERLGKLLVRERERAAVAVFSLANAATPEAKGWLLRALGGDFSDKKVRAAAALAVVGLTDQQRFLPRLRELAMAASTDPGKSAALLALARIGDAEAAAAVAEALPLWRDRELLERGLLLCSTTLDRPLAELLSQERSAPVAELWTEIGQIQASRRDPRLLHERIAAALTAARAHWTLARDDLRMAVLRDLLELDKVVRDDADEGPGEDNDVDSGFDAMPKPGEQPDPPKDDAPPPPDSGGDDGGDDGGGAPAPPKQGGSEAGAGLQARRGRPEMARIEVDLRQWLIDYPPFEVADPFAR